MRDIFNSYNVGELRKFATSYNKNVKITGVAKMKKNELVEALMKHTQFFKDVKKKGEKPVKEPVKKPVKEPVKEPIIKDIKKVKKIKMNIKKVVKPDDKKEPVKAPPPVFPATPEITIDDLVDNFDTPFSANVLSQYSINRFNILEGFLRRVIKNKGTVDIDQFLASGTYLSKDIVRKVILKYGVKKAFEYVQDLLKQMLGGDGDLKTTVNPEALTNKMKNRTVSKFFKRDMKNVKL